MASTVLTVVLWILAVCCTLTVAVVQFGDQFPEGLLVGSDSPCSDDTHTGRIRFNQEAVRVEFCSPSLLWVPVGAAEADSPTSIALLQRRVFCSGHGEFNASSGQCACSNSLAEGYHTGPYCYDCQTFWTKDVNGSCTLSDMDSDTIPDTDDNCPLTANVGQEDRNSNGKGDACDFEKTCAEYLALDGNAPSGVYTIDLDTETGAMDPFQVYCDMETDGGGWTVFQRRIDGSENFIRMWNDYKNGFGTASGEYWMGNDRLHFLTTEATSDPMEVRLDYGVAQQYNTIGLEYLDGYARYYNYSVADESDNYRLSVGAMFEGRGGDSLSYHSGRAFTTQDRDNDDVSDNCAVRHDQGGWYYGGCWVMSPNGKYRPGQQSSGNWEIISHISFLSDPLFGLSHYRMMLRESACNYGNGGCDQICVRKQDASTTCACRPGYELSSDNSTCISHRSCQEIMNNPAVNHGTGVYWIDPDGSGAFEVFCDMDTSGGGWTVFQRRFDGSIEFYRGWDEYKAGFGRVDTEFWLGNDNLHRLTTSVGMQARVEVGVDPALNTLNVDPTDVYDEWTSFSIADEGDQYRLSVGEYIGGNGGNSLTHHSGMMFTTHDRDNDNSASNCAVTNAQGGFWFTSCYSMAPNGPYRVGPISSTYRWKVMAYLSWIGTGDYGLAHYKMMLREADCAANNGGCSQLCVHVDGGSHYCDCHPGFWLGADNSTCHGHTSCRGIRDDPTVNNGTGAYWIDVDGNSGPTAPMEVYCDMDTDGGGWTVFQHRYNGEVDFVRGWSDYKNGFGSASGEFWLGNDNIHALTESTGMQLRVDVGIDPSQNTENVNPTDVYATWQSFHITNETDKYRLTVGQFLGGLTGDGLSGHSGRQFTTQDNDNDDNGSGNCATANDQGGFWYTHCYSMAPNGPYRPGLNDPSLTWKLMAYLPWIGNGRYGLAKYKMMVRETACALNNGGCEHNCVIDDDHHHHCECLPGFALQADNTSCVGHMSCKGIRDSSLNIGSGIYWIDVDGTGPEEPIEVYCDMDTDGGGWIVFQRRMDGSVEFYRGWTEYQNGFGSKSGEFWLGNGYLHTITTALSLQVRVDVAVDPNQNTHNVNPTEAHALYASFSVGDAASFYQLSVGSFLGGAAGDSLSYHSGRAFSTYDQDHDASPGNCAADNHQGGHWFGHCWTSSPNGPYRVGPISSNTWQVITYLSWISDGNYGLSAFQMMLREP